MGIKEGFAKIAQVFGSKPKEVAAKKPEPAINPPSEKHSRDYSIGDRNRDLYLARRAARGGK